MDAMYTHVPLVLVCVDTYRNLGHVVKMGGMVCGDYLYINLQGEGVQI